MDVVGNNLICFSIQRPTIIIKTPKGMFDLKWTAKSQSLMVGRKTNNRTKTLIGGCLLPTLAWYHLQGGS